MFLYKSLNINILKRRLYFPQNTYVFLEKVVHVFSENHVHVFTESHDRKQERIWKYTISLPYHQI